MHPIDCTPAPQAPLETSSQAALATTVLPTEIQAMHATFAATETVARNICVASTLTLNPGWPSVPDLDMMSQYAAGLLVKLTLSPATVAHLRQLHSALLALDADELTEWASSAICQVERLSADGSAPSVATVIGVGATIYATGEVHFSVNFEELEHALWLKDTVEIDELERAAAPRGAT